MAYLYPLCTNTNTRERAAHILVQLTSRVQEVLIRKLTALLFNFLVHNVINNDEITCTILFYNGNK